MSFLPDIVHGTYDLQFELLRLEISYRLRAGDMMLLEPLKEQSAPQSDPSQIIHTIHMPCSVPIDFTSEVPLRGYLASNQLGTVQLRVRHRRDGH